MDKKKQRKQRSMMYTQQMRLAKLPDWKEENCSYCKANKSFTLGRDFT